MRQYTIKEATELLTLLANSKTSDKKFTLNFYSDYLEYINKYNDIGCKHTIEPSYDDLGIGIIYSVFMKKSLKPLNIFRLTSKQLLDVAKCNTLDYTLVTELMKKHLIKGDLK